MTSKLLNIRYEALDEAELNDEDRQLVERAKAATLTSYAPYSHFSVGAAIRMSDGQIFGGSNQENAAFSAGTCAERCTLFYAQAQAPQATVTAIAVAARGTDGQFTKAPISPCGVCRQALMEAQTLAKGHPIRVLLYGASQIWVLEGIESLLPFGFKEIS